jgi:hypothetical protein
MKTCQVLPGGVPLVLLSVALVLVVGASPSGLQEEGSPVVFEEKLIQDRYGYAYGIGAADLDGDGHIDLVSSDTTNNALYWFANDGKGNFQRYFIMKDEQGWFERLAIGDVNGDGKPDVVVVKNLHGDIVWFENSGKPRQDAVWKRHVIARGTLPGAYDVVLADLDGDGKLDVAASSWSRGNRFVWYQNPGLLKEGSDPLGSDPFFSSPGKDRHDKQWPAFVIEDKVAETRTIRAGDFNGDGKIDLLGTASAGNLVVWYENPGQPATRPWKKHIIDDKTPRPIHGHPVDLDGDGDLDVVMALGMNAANGQKDTHQIVWYENVGKRGDGTTWKKHIICESFPQAFEVVAADINGDGHLDVVATAWGPKPGGRVAWFENPGNPRQVPWKMHVLKEGWTNANSVIVADLNADKRLDIIATAERGANELRWWRNDGRTKK